MTQFFFRNIFPQALLFLLVCMAQNEAAAQCPNTNPIVVTNTNVDGTGSLAFAINCLNTVTPLTQINFNIPGGGSHIIRPTTRDPLPPVSKNNAVIDASTQPSGQVILDGSLLGGGSSGLTLQANSITVRGLSATNFTNGINIAAGANVVAEDNDINTNSVGIFTGPNAISFTARNNSLGTSAATRNTSNGIFVSGSTTAGKIENNTIGNSTTGIFTPGIGNVLITQNSIFCNSSAGISRSSGPAAPVITQATTQMIKGTTGTPGATIEIFINSTQNCAGAPCQGRSYLGTTTAVGNDWIFNPAGLVGGGDQITVTATENSNNTSVFSTCATVIDCQSFAVSINSSDITCFGFNDGEAVAMATSPPPVNFVWNTGETTASISGLTPGTYTVTATDRSGCVDDESVVIAEPDPLVISLTATDASCFGENNGSIQSNISGGTTPYFYLWSDNSTGANLLNAPAGIYVLQLNDANNCFEVAADTIFEPDLLVANATATDESAAGANDGTAAANPSGGILPYNFNWSNGQTSASITNLAPGNYTVTVSDANNCRTVETVTVLPGMPAGGCDLEIVAMNATNLDCFGDADGSIAPVLSGGGAPFTFQWSNGQTDSIAVNLQAGSFQLIVIDAAGCRDTAAADITQPDLLVANATATDESSAGANDGTAAANPAGGTMPYNFNWSNGQTGASITNLTPGNYTVTVSDANNCAATQTVTVLPGMPAGGCDLEIVAMNATNLDCFSDADGSIAPVLSGGGAPFTFQWSNGQTDSIAVNLQAGSFQLIVIDAAGCRDTATADITQPDLLVANATATDESAAGANDGTAAANPSGGTMPYNFNWSNGQTGASITNLAPGNYTVTISDANNCTAMQSVTVLPGTPAGGCGTFAGTMNLSPLALCEQDTAFAIHNGNEILESGDLLEFILHDRSDTILGNIFGQKNSPAFFFLPVLERGKTYYISAVAGRDDGTGFVDLNDPCLSVSPGTPVVFNRQPLPAYALQAPDVVCGNEPFLLEADDLFPNPSITYHWLLANGTIFQTSAPEFTVLPTSGDFTGDYFVARDSGACLSKFSPPVFVEIISLPSGEIMTGQDTILCNQNTFELSAQQPSSGQGRWHSVTFSTIQNPTQPNTTVTNLQPGENIFVWSVSVGACRDALADTLRVFVEQPPLLRDDEYTLQRASDIIAMNVLLNDRIGGISDTTVTLLGAPEFGDLEYLENKKSFRYSLSEERRGRVQFQYVVCNGDAICGEACDTATVVINVLALPEMPEGLTLNGDGRNDVLTIRGIRGFERVEVLIVNRWGDVVFEEKDYDNDRPWRGTLGYEGSELPQGAYYYIVKAFENGSLVGDPLTGVVHIFK